MKSVAKLNSEIEGINQTMVQVEAQIVEKQAQIKDLKENNARLIEQNLSKLRKPPSLKLQREKVNDLNCQIQELQFVQGSLKEKLEKTSQELSEASIRHRLEQYAKAEAYQLSLIQKVQDLFAQYVNAIGELEGHRNALELLVRINGDLNGKKLVDYGVDLEAVIKLFSQAILSYNFDPSRIDRLNTTNRNLMNQLDAIRQNRRSYPHAPVRNAPTVQRVPHVDPLRQARLYEKHRLESENDLNKAMKGKTQIIPHHR